LAYDRPKRVKWSYESITHYFLAGRESSMNRKFSTLWFGEEITVEIPEGNLLNVLEPHEKPQLKDPEGKLRSLLENPIGCKKLVDIVKHGDKVALISSEYNRLPYTWILAPVVVDVLKKEVGVKDDNIFIVNAPGTHQSEEEQTKNPLVPRTWGVPLWKA